MKYLKSVCVFRYDEKKHVWEKRVFEHVLVSGTQENFRLSDTLDRDAYTVLRIMRNPCADVLPQDIVVLSDKCGDVPPDAGFGVVVSVTHNTQGGRKVQHTKIICR